MQIAYFRAEPDSLEKAVSHRHYANEFVLKAKPHKNTTLCCCSRPPPVAKRPPTGSGIELQLIPISLARQILATDCQALT